MDAATRAERADRLRKAREKKGFKTASEAADAYGWPKSAYISHENGHRGLLPDPAARYAKGLGVTPEFLLFGKKGPAPAAPKSVPLVGRVSAGARMYFSDQATAGDTVPAPSTATESTVAVEVDGDSLGPAFNGWLVFYDDVHSPVREDLIGELCVVGLADGRVLIKVLHRARVRGLFHLLPNASGEPPIMDVEVEWAAKVRSMRARR